MVDSVAVNVIDNCYLWPMSNMDVEVAFAERIIEIQERTRAYRTHYAQEDDTTLPLTWPLSVFSNPEEPRALYVAHDTTQPDEEPSSFLGFLEAKMHARDYAKIVSCVVLGAPSDSVNIDVTKKMFDALVEDCVSMDIPTITIPRNWSDYTTNEQYTSARYNFSTTDSEQRRAHVAAICIALCRNYPYLVFKTPFKIQYIVVTPQSAQFIDKYITLFLNGPRHRTFDVYRAYNVSMWRLEDANSNQQQVLTPLEVDIVVGWQRKQIAHQALELEPVSNRPLRLFGKTIILAPEDPDRLVVVGARRRIDIPPEAARAENHLWIDAITEMSRPPYAEEKVAYVSQIDTDDSNMRTRRLNARREQNDQVRALESNMSEQRSRQEANQPRRRRQQQANPRQRRRQGELHQERRRNRDVPPFSDDAQQTREEIARAISRELLRPVFSQFHRASTNVDVSDVPPDVDASGVATESHVDFDVPDYFRNENEFELGGNSVHGESESHDLNQPDDPGDVGFRTFDDLLNEYESDEHASDDNFNLFDATFRLD